MDKRVVLVAFNGEAMCFIHVLLNALDMEAKGYKVKVVIEGSATKLVETLGDTSHPLSQPYLEVREKGMIDCVCYACATKMEAVGAARAQGLPLCKDMKGHPSIADYMDEGYKVITF
ncbi:MAG: cytoplasmic protein [Desulfobacterium sp.]|nr:cytoplasmic protein [Desulfobacterium sp.]